MLTVIACIVFNTLIFVIFKSFKQIGAKTLNAVVINYLVCAGTGFLVTGPKNSLTYIYSSIGTSGFYLAMLLGLMFVTTFYTLAFTTQKLNITVTTISTKTSLIITIIFSLFVLQLQSKEYTFINYLGIVLAFMAIYISSIYGKLGRKKEGKLDSYWWLPVICFFLSGIVDVTINITNYKHVQASEAHLFPILIFTFSTLFGLLSLLIKRVKINRRDVYGGLLLGIPNYFSIVLVLMALNYFKNDGAIFFPVLNMGVIGLSPLFGWIFFKEKLSSETKIGVILAVISLIMLSYQEVLLLI